MAAGSGNGLHKVTLAQVAVQAAGGGRTCWENSSRLRTSKGEAGCRNATDTGAGRGTDVMATTARSGESHKQEQVKTATRALQITCCKLPGCRRAARAAPKTKKVQAQSVAKALKWSVLGSRRGGEIAL